MTLMLLIDYFTLFLLIFYVDTLSFFDTPLIFAISRHVFIATLMFSCHYFRHYGFDDLLLPLFSLLLR